MSELAGVDLTAEAIEELLEKMPHASDEAIAALVEGKYPEFYKMREGAGHLDLEIESHQALVWRVWMARQRRQIEKLVGKIGGLLDEQREQARLARAVETFNAPLRKEAR
ncbi:MAG TPA: hypothetical protein VKB88_08195 [Bryobacteraceae bacterium]|nr:hypothetical protein [Bryobacteraceae bacterium]